MPPPMPQLDGVEHRYETVNGIRIHYAEAGSGEPLILQHGWPQHWWSWREVIGPLAQRFRVVVPDLRGHGWSDKPRSSYLKTELMDDLVALLDKLGLDRVRMIGHDWGAHVGMLAALRHPQRIERLISLGMPHPWRRRGPTPHAAALFSYQLVMIGPWGNYAMRHGAIRQILRLGRKNGKFTPAELDTYDEIIREPDTAAASVQLYRTFVRRELRPLATGTFKSERLTVPTLWILGRGDVFSAIADDGYKDNADDMTLELLPECGHFVPEEVPERLVERALAFL